MRNLCAAWPEGESVEQVREGQTSDARFHIGRPVEQQITMEPYLEGDDVFYVWPLIEPVEGRLCYSAPTGRLLARPRDLSGEPRGTALRCKVRTSGLADGQQAPLVPASGKVFVPPLLQMPGDGTDLPRLGQLAARWAKESGLPPHQHRELAYWFEKRLSGSGQFHYTLQGQERDTSIDAIEDFVSNNPRGHCEYFATALALMLRSRGIPSRIVLGYRCDEWHEDQQCYQVRQLHAHAWVEAFLGPKQVPADLRRSEPLRWVHGGWLRLDATPASEVGSEAADRTMWGAWQRRWHGLERSWDKYVVDMDCVRQRESVYEPISRATRNLARQLFDFRWWRGLAAGLWAFLAATLRSGLVGWLLGMVLLIVLVIVPAAAGWWLLRRLVRLWAGSRPPAGGVRRGPGVRSSSTVVWSRLPPAWACGADWPDAARVRPHCRRSPGRGKGAAGSRRGPWR